MDRDYTLKPDSIGGWELRLIEDGAEVGGFIFEDHAEAKQLAEAWLSEEYRGI